MSHQHDHSVHHPHGESGHRERRLLIAFALTAAMLVVEGIGGWLSGSLALLADAAHMLVDAGALMFAWLGAYFARRPADALRSFGYARLEVLVGYSNALIQFVLVAWIVVEALLRLRSQQPILSGLMFAVAFAGLIVNVFVLSVLGGHDHDDLNTASARLHVLGDLFGSLGAIVAAVLIRYLDWLWADPVASILVSLLILSSAWRLLRRSGHILLEGVPEGIDARLVGSALRNEGIGILEVHHIHIWQLAGGRGVATLHARLVEGADSEIALTSIRAILRERFRVEHATVQIEQSGCVDTGCAPERP